MEWFHPTMTVFLDLQKMLGKHFKHIIPNGGEWWWWIPFDPIRKKIIEKTIPRYWYLVVYILIANVGEYTSPMDFWAHFLRYFLVGLKTKAPQRHLSPCCRKRSVCGKMAPKKPRVVPNQHIDPNPQKITRIYLFQVGPQEPVTTYHPNLPAQEFLHFFGVSYI